MPKADLRSWSQCDGCARRGLQGLRRAGDGARPARRRAVPGHRRRLRPVRGGRPTGATRILVGRDMRPTGVEFAGRVRRGVQGQGLDVVDLGLASTDLVYFASGRLEAPAAMFTASHNPAQYNGIKFCLAGAKAVGQRHRPRPHQGHGRAPGSRRRPPSRASSRASTCSTTSPSTSARSSTSRCCVPLKVVADTANGMGGLVVPAVFAKLPFDLELLYGELDGTLPEPPGRPHPGREPGRPAGPGPRDRCRCRPRLRRRRRPGVRGRREGRAHLGFDHHRDGRGRHPRQGARRHRSCTT